jgi:hypothetical protein
MMHLPEGVIAIVRSDVDGFGRRFSRGCRELDRLAGNGRLRRSRGGMTGPFRALRVQAPRSSTPPTAATRAILASAT